MARAVLQASMTLLSILLGMVPLAGAELYVSPSGDDRAAGTRAAPFRTLARAQRALRERKASAGLPEGGATVVLLPGVYRLSQPLVLTPEDSGEPGKPIVYRASEPGKAVLTSEAPVEGWRRLTEDHPLAPPEASGRLWSAAIQEGWSFRSLFVDGKPMRRASWPDSDSWRRWPTLRAVGPAGVLGTRLQFRPKALEGLPVNGDAEVLLLDPLGSFTQIGVLRQIDPIDSRANLASRNPTGVPSTEWRYRLENGLSMLNEPGEWCVDSLRGRVFLWPVGDDLRGRRVEASRLTQLVRLQGDASRRRWISHVRWVGVVFRGTDRTPEDRWPDGWVTPVSAPAEAALTISDAEACSVEGCRFEDTGAWGLAIEGRARSCRVVGNRFERTGAGGLLLVGAGASRDHGRHTVERNAFSRLGASGYWQSPAVLVCGSHENRIAWNRFERLPWAAVALLGPPQPGLAPLAESVDAYGNPRNRWRGRSTAPQEDLRPSKNAVEGNWIVEAMERLDLGGAVLGWSCGGENAIRGNAIHSLSGAVGNHPVWLDRATRGNVVEGNRIWAPGTLKDDGSNAWRDNPISSTRFAAYDALVEAIRREAERLGGWPAIGGR
ncbi:MAG: right-handed parallel beta-helix repeat-containing protein [Fimbriimonadales bacterium]|nr:right-handed parallel beta-helix repeat-containing protein [Fimbriimonadales bacterium]